MKKILMSILCMMCVLGMSGCGNNKSSKGSKGSTNEEFGKQDLSIKDFEWETEKTYIDGEKCYAMTLTNNSDYDIIGVEIDYKVKSSASDDDLKAFDDFMEEHGDWFDEDDTKHDITLIGTREKLVKKGEKINQVALAIGMDTRYWYNIPNETQFNLMEPKTLQLGVIDNQKVLHLAYYDFGEKTWTLDETTKKVKSWPKNDLAQKIPEPNSDYYVVTSDDDSEDIDFTIYGTTKDYYKEYLKQVKDAGFTEDDGESDTYYSAKDKDGNSISVSYKKGDANIDVSAYPKY